MTSSGQTENNSAKCIIHGKRPRVSNCFHLSALLVQTLLNSVKKLCSVMGGGGWEGGARGSQCSLFTIYNSALLRTSGQGVSGGEWGGLGGGREGLSSRKESIGRLRRRNSFIVFQSDETLFLWKSQLLIQQHRLRPNFKHFCFLL